MNEYELIGRLADLDRRLQKLEGVDPAPRLAEVKAEMKPTGLVEAVDEYIKDTDANGVRGLFVLEEALNRERRIAEKRENLLKELRHLSQFCVWYSDQVTDLLGCLKAYDEECAK